MQKSPFVSIIIINWNGKKWIDNCLRSLRKIQYPSYEIIFADNASTDDSVQYVQTHYPYVHILRNEKNIGFAEGNDKAFQSTKGDAILLLNLDTIVDRFFLHRLVAKLYSCHTIGVVQPKVLLYPQKDRIDSIGSFFLPNGLLYHYGREKFSNEPQYTVSRDIFTAKGVCMLVKREVIERAGLFDKDYFAYYEETDFCMRVWMSGYFVVSEPKAIIYHKGGGAFGDRETSFIQFHSFKNVLCTYIKNLSLMYNFRVIPSLMALYSFMFSFYMFTGKPKIAFSIVRALAWNIIHAADTLRKRIYIQTHIRRISDKDYLPKLTKNVRFSYYYHQAFGGLDTYKDTID